MWVLNFCWPIYACSVAQRPGSNLCSTNLEHSTSTYDTAKFYHILDPGELSTLAYKHNTQSPSFSSCASEKKCKEQEVFTLANALQKYHSSAPTNLKRMTTDWVSEQMNKWRLNAESTFQKWTAVWKGLVEGKGVPVLQLSTMPWRSIGRVEG